MNYNGGRFIGRCLQALANQRDEPSQIIVVDNASTDGSAELVASKYPGVTLLRQQSNIGFAAGNNRAFEKVVQAEWVALLNPDTEAGPDWITELRKGVRDNPEVDMFSCRLVSDGESGTLDGTGDIYHGSGLGWRRDHGVSAGIRRDVDEIVFGPCAAAALYRLDKVLAAGAFDERYFCYNEDIDLAFRMRLRGARCLHLDHCEVVHAGSGITGKDSDFTVYHGHRNLVWTFFKNMPTTLLWRYLPAHLVLNLATIVIYTLKGRPGVILRAKWHAIKGLRWVLAERRAQQDAVGDLTHQRIDLLRNAMADGFLTPYFGRRG